MKFLLSLPEPFAVERGVFFPAGCIAELGALPWEWAAVVLAAGVGGGCGRSATEVAVIVEVAEVEEVRL